MKKLMILIMMSVFALTFVGCGSEEVKINLSEGLEFPAKINKYDRWVVVDLEKIAGNQSALISVDKEKIKEWKEDEKRMKFIKNVKIGDLEGKLMSFKGRTYYVIFEKGNLYMSVSSKKRGFDLYKGLENFVYLLNNYNYLKTREVKNGKSLSREDMEKMTFVKNAYSFYSSEVNDTVENYGYSLMAYIKENPAVNKVEIRAVRYEEVSNWFMDPTYDVLITGVNAFGAPVKNRYSYTISATTGQITNERRVY